MSFTTTVGELVQRTRVALGLNRAELARQIGYRNIGKGMRRIDALESDGCAHPELLAKVIALLGIDPAEINEALASDEKQLRLDFEKWASEKVPPEVHDTAIPGFWVQARIPPEVRSEQEIIEYARKLSGSNSNRKAAAVLDRRRTVWIVSGKVTNTTMAEPGKPNIPYMTLNGSKGSFVIRTGSEVSR